jgi:hypothetical protein
MTQQTAPIAAGDLRTAIRDLDARGQRPAGLVMSPETWAVVADAADADRGQALYAGLPVWTRTDCDGVELIGPRSLSTIAENAEPVWI